MRLHSLDDVFQEQIEDLHSAEAQLVAALPAVAEAAQDDKLRAAVREHLDETREHMRRIEDIQSEMGIPLGADERCEAMAGLIREGEEIVSADGSPAVKDAALIAAAQRIEHYEIAAYGTAKALANELGHDNAKQLLDTTLNEESKADALLTKIASGGVFKTGINEAASSAGSA